MKKEENSVAFTIGAILGFFAGAILVILADTFFVEPYRKASAIERNNAYYNPTNGVFTWRYDIPPMNHNAQ